MSLEPRYARATLARSLLLWMASLIILASNVGAFTSLESRSRPSMAIGSTPESAAEEANRFKEQARKLREEIDSFQQGKDDMEEAERRQTQEELDARQVLVDLYSAVVPILKPDGTTLEEKVQFPPKLCVDEDQKSVITVIEAPLPLGMILGEHETIQGMTVVDEVAEGSNAAAAGIHEGDLLRACTACRVEMDQPMWQLMAGGIGRPKTMRYMFGTDFKPFEQVMEAVGSNRLDPEARAVLLVIERETQ
jgi:hypothetical protein